MSRDYRMKLAIECTLEQARRIDAAIEDAEMWPFDLRWRAGLLSGGGDSQLCAGESEEQFAGRVRDIVWRAVQEKVPVCVYPICLEAERTIAFGVDCPAAIPPADSEDD
jgi:hypothetical protein